MWEKRLRRKDDAQHIRVHLACEILVVHALEQTSEPIGRIVEQHVQPSPFCRRGGKAGLDLVRHADIAWQDQRIRVVACHCRECVRIAPDQPDAIACRQKRGGGGGTDAAPGAGDDD